MSERSEESSQKLDSLIQRIEDLERDNERLRRKVEPILGPDVPWMDTPAFLRAIRQTVLVCMVPVYVALPVILLGGLVLSRVAPNVRIGPVPLMDYGGQGSRHPGLGIGVIAFGGGAVGGIAAGGGALGVIAVGGMAVGLIAFGGGAIGAIAVGGGSVGLIAIGGGAVGYIAIGDSAVGWYALGRSARGRYALGLNRQDLEAVAFFRQLVPGLRKAVTMPMPVVPLDKSRRSDTITGRGT
ncbi:MAG: hypothetical protein ACM359_17890 [Bacillota bacterium]